MATIKEIERLAVVEEKVDRMRDDLCIHIEKQDKFEVRIENKLDAAILGKAEKSDVDKLDNRFWGIIVSLLALTLGVIFALFK